MERSRNVQKIVELAAAPRMKIDAVGLLILTNGQQRRVSNKWGVRSVHPAGDVYPIRVRAQGMVIQSWFTINPFPVLVISEMTRVSRASLNLL